MRVSFHPDYYVELPPGHPFPMAKFPELHARLLADGDLMADVAAIDPPAMVLCGGADTITPPDAVREIAAAFPGGRPYHEIPGAGHASYLEGAADYNRLLARFADGLT